MPKKLDTLLLWLCAPFLVAATFAFRLVVGTAMILLIVGWKAANVCRPFPAPRPT
ncbi:MAG: hypothetical protein ICV73_16440 [Acetobacteraceae bacterium]|nr:hypothetical protein [Acetobacteraceae bacterium]